MTTPRPNVIPFPKKDRALDNPVLRMIDALQAGQDARVRSKLDAIDGVWR
jgi:hypothetical protein